MSTIFNESKFKAELSGFTGTEEFYKNPMFPGCCYTEGVKFLARECQAYWLIDAVFSYVGKLRKHDDWFYPVKLEERENDWLLRIGDIDNPLKIEQVIEFSDFPLKDLKLFLANNEGGLGWTLMLPSEY